MDLRQLDVLIAIADHGTFSAAAAALHTVQSNVSTHVARLERELGVTLVDRAGVVLTAEGQLVVERARRVRTELDALVADISALRDVVAGTVRLGIIGTTARWLVPQLLPAMAERYPGVHLVVVEASTTSLLPQLLAGQLDDGVLNLPINDPDIAAEPLFGEDLVVVVRDDHELAERDTVTLADLGSIELLLPPRGTAYRDELDDAARRAGVTLHAKAELDGVRLIASLAFQRFGPAVLPATAVPAWMAGRWRRVSLTGIPRRLVGHARRRRGLPSAPSRALAEVLTDVITEAFAHQPGIHHPGDAA